MTLKTPTPIVVMLMATTTAVAMLITQTPTLAMLKTPTPMVSMQIIKSMPTVSGDVNDEAGDDAKIDDSADADANAKVDVDVNIIMIFTLYQPLGQPGRPWILSLIDKLKIVKSSSRYATAARAPVLRRIGFTTARLKASNCECSFCRMLL